jgi:copper chaperone CopZ
MVIMHMIFGFVLASLLKKKGVKSPTLPSIIGKFEVAHAIPGRIRYSAPLLVNSDTLLLNRIDKELTKVDGIKSVQSNPISGSLIVIYDEAQIEDYVVHGIALKVLGLEKELEHTPESILLRELKLLGRALNQQIYQSSAGLLDLNSSLMITLVTIALYRIVFMQERTLPSGLNLLWWAYVISRSGK